MKVLSLFDGISCGYEALIRAGVKIDKYYASEIDNTAIGIAKYRHEDIIHLGDVENIDYTALGKIDIIIGGSPCQGFSVAGKREGLKHHESRLLTKFIDVVNTVKPKYYFLENVRLPKEVKTYVLNSLNGCKSYTVNSLCVAPQSRVREYYTNINMCDTDNVFRVKSISDFEDFREYIHGRKFIYPYINIRPLSHFSIRLIDALKDKEKGLSIVKYEKILRLTEYKVACYCISSMEGILYRPAYTLTRNSVIGGSNVSIIIDDGNVTALSAIEFERLQTLPDDYTKYAVTEKGKTEVSRSKRCAALGNAWTVDVIKKFFERM